MPSAGTEPTVLDIGRESLKKGLRLAEVPDAKVEVIQLFAVFHDAGRLYEGVDDGHGERGAKLAFELHDDLFHLKDDEFELLYEASARHTDGLIEAGITIQTCWDADRLDLGRVGIMPEPTKLCTPAARKPSILEWADGRATFEVVPDLVKNEWGLICGDKRPILTLSPA